MSLFDSEPESKSTFFLNEIQNISVGKFSDFYGREYYLAVLQKNYDLNAFSGFAVYGRRRVGKSYLLQYFCKDKCSIYVQASEKSDEVNFESLYSAILESSIILTEKEKGFLASCSSFLELIEFVFFLSLSRRFIFVIDEYTFLHSLYEQISSEIMRFIEKYRHGSKMLFIICGSNIGMMKQEFSSEAPLYDRIQPLLINPFAYWESDHWLHNYSFTEKYMVYTITGGYPPLLKAASENTSIGDFLRKDFLGPYGKMLWTKQTNIQTERLLDYELSEEILKALSSGKNSFSQIFCSTSLHYDGISKNSEEYNHFNKVLEQLIYLDIIRKYSPKGLHKGKLYHISDAGVAFWMIFIYPYLNRLEEKDQLSELAVLANKTFLTFIDKSYEDTCRKYLSHFTLKLQLLNITSVDAAYYNKDKRSNDLCEIDIFGELINDIKLFGECKYRSEVQGLNTLAGLKHKAEIFSLHEYGSYNESHSVFVIISKAGFTKDLIEEADKSSNVILLTDADIYACRCPFRFEDIDF